MTIQDPDRDEETDKDDKEHEDGPEDCGPPPDPGDICSDDATKDWDED